MNTKAKTYLCSKVQELSFLKSMASLMLDKFFENVFMVVMKYDTEYKSIWSLSTRSNFQHINKDCFFSIAKEED